MAHIQFPAKLEPLFKPARYKVCYGGRAGMKSWGIARALLIEGTTKPLRILCAREVQRSIKDSVHKLLSDQIAELGLGAFYEILQTEIRGKNGTEFLFAGLSTQTIDSIKSFEGCDRCWVEEGQSVRKRSWTILIPTIRKPGSEIWVSFNPDLDTDDTWVRFVENTPPNTTLIPISYRDNPWLSNELKSEMEHLKRISVEEYENVWEGKCRAAAEGAIYKREMTALADSNRICAVPIDPLMKVHTVWDLGFNDSTAVIFVQRHVSEVRVVDYLEDSHKTIAEYVSELKSRPWNWGTDWIPWDGSRDRYRLTDATTSPEDILRKLGRNVSIVPKIDVETGIKKARLVFPRCTFDKERTVRLRECLKRYRRTIPVSTDEPASPLHDEFSHGADAFRYLSVCVDQMTNDDDGWKKALKYDNRGIV